MCCGWQAGAGPGYTGAHGSGRACPSSPSQVVVAINQLIRFTKAGRIALSVYESVRELVPPSSIYYMSGRGLALRAHDGAKL